ncbi:hypothetical protein QJS26_gp43 [Serratia phage vB_SmaS_Stoker]|uniref:Uncharacterized protein n=1 Tax=Serratia phage vB_SmaS_Stoker TaxID=2902692 RepID=A0AC61TQG9_9CAUD|nr:hypothetical protein QJS25_gp50 [Serratia phage vB_SmaS_Bonzee]YP_010774224.1 hypothetical protein QJS26_gp43 [Serratia phage vB_SmaS_Stoker]UGO53790.1 hypothetical protein STOKER_43 [Serratia phage vB_SmaS_Stoker]UKL15188.1 hypothetical protein BONZEE_50 [Serratia phage vB_SmaS_Bonzee]
MNGQFNNNGFNGQQQNGFNGQQQNGFQPQNGFQQQNPGYGEPSGGMFVDGNATADSGSGDLPVGKYLVQITNAEYKANNQGSGSRLSIECTVMDGVYANRKLFDGYNLQHSNPVAQNIGQSQYAKLCESAFGKGAQRPTNPQALIGASFVIDWGYKHKKKSNANDQYGGEENDIPRPEVLDRLPVTAIQQQPQQPQQQNVMNYGQQQQQQQQQQYQQPQNGFQGQQQQQQNGFNGQQQFQQNPGNAGDGQQQNGFQPQNGGQSFNGQQNGGQNVQQQNQQENAGQSNQPLQQGQAPANGTPGNVSGSPFGQGFNQM